MEVQKGAKCELTLKNNTIELNMAKPEKINNKKMIKTETQTD